MHFTITVAHPKSPASPRFDCRSTALAAGLARVCSLLPVLLAFILAGIAVPAPVSAATWNLTGDLGSHDPALTKEGSRWWCYNTGPGVQALFSDNGTAWTRGQQVFAGELPWWRDYAPAMGTNDVWAPDVFFYNNRWWLYYSVSEFGTNNSAIGLTSCTSLQTADWRDDGLVISSTSGIDNYNAIDPNLTIDAAGGLWLAFGSWFDGIKLVAIDRTTMLPANSVLYSLAKRSDGIEGPFVVYKNPYYYLFASIDHCCSGANSDYKIVVGRASSITGPYRDKNGLDLLLGGGTVVHSSGSGSRYKGPGGQSLYGTGVIAHHVYDSLQNGAALLSISDLLWDANAWPYIYTASSGNGFYQITNKRSGKFFEVYAASLANGATIDQWGTTGNPCQEWMLYNWGEGFSRIENRNSHKYAEVSGASLAPGARLGQYGNTNNACQEWTLSAVTGGYYKLVNRNSGQVAEVQNSSIANGAIIQQNSFTGADNQLWQLIWKTY